MTLAVFFRRTDAQLGTLIGGITVIIGVFVALGGGADLIPGVISITAGFLLLHGSSPHNGALKAFSLKLVYFALLLLAAIVVV